MLLPLTSYAATPSTPEQTAIPGGIISGPQNLQNLIEEKSKELQKIQDERKAIERELQSVSQVTNSLSKEIKTINTTVSQLDASIRENKVTVEKLGFEIQSLNEEIKSIQVGVGSRKEVLAKLLVELQQRDKGGLFITLLKGKTLSENVSEIQTLFTLNDSIVTNLDDLRRSHSELKTKLQDIDGKRNSREQETLTLAYRQAIIKDEQQSKQVLLQATRSQEQVYESKIAEIEKKQSEISVVIEEIEHKIRASFDPSILPLKRPGVFALPILNGVTTQGYGATAFAARAYKSKFHNGIDFGVPIGTPVYAAEDGIVGAVDNNDLGTSRWQKYQYGRYITIKHDNNLSTLYAHLSKQLVSEGQRVVRGEIIGYTGNSGYATGPHLHFTIFWTPSIQYKGVPPSAGFIPIGVTVDPSDYL